MYLVKEVEIKMICPACHTKNPYFNNFCYHCGHDLKIPISDSEDIDFKKDKENNIDQKDHYNIDINRPTPLRQHRSDDNKKRKNILLILLFILLAIIVFSMVLLYIYPNLNLTKEDKPPVSDKIRATSSVEEITYNGKNAYKLYFQTENGEEINLLNQILKVKDGSASITIDERELYSLNPQITEDGLHVVEIEVTISALGFQDLKENFVLPLFAPYDYAPFLLVEPKSLDLNFNENTSKVIFEVLPDSKIQINGVDESASVDDNGIYNNTFNLANEEELVLDIKITYPGYLDNNQQLILRKTPMDVFIEIRDPMPIKTDEEWALVKGVIEPGASLEANREIFEEIKINEETGDFELYLKTEAPGYNLAILTAKSGNKETSIEVIIDHKTTVESYSTTAWKADYSELSNNPNLSQGKHFAISGIIMDLIENNDNTIFILKPNDEVEDALYYIEYWGSFNFQIDDNIRVFANRWGNMDHMPRFLAKYIYE